MYKGKNADYNIIDILETGQKPEQDTNKIFTDLVSGQIAAQQSFFFTTHSIKKYISEYNLKRILSAENITQIEMQAYFREITNNENFCGVILRNMLVNARSTSKEAAKPKVTAPLTVNEENDSMSHLETQRHKTQELLTPTLGPKIQKFLTETLPERLRFFELPDWRPVRVIKSKVPARLPKNRGLETKIPFDIHSIFNRIVDFGLTVFSLFKSVYAFVRGRIQKEYQPAEKMLPQKSTAAPSYTQQQKLLIGSIVAITLILIGSGFYIRNQRIVAQQEMQYTALLASIEDTILKGESSAVHSAFERARIYQKEATQQIEQLQQFERFLTTETKQQLEQKVSSLGDSINRIRRADLHELVNLQTEFAATQSIGTELFNNKLYIYNDTNPYLGIVQVNNQKVTIANADENNISIQDLTIFERNNNSPLVLTTNNELYQFNQANLELEKSSANLFDDTTRIKTYNSNVYTLNPTDDQIYKFTQISTNKFNRGTGWLKSDTDLSTATDLFIDGSIYVLQADGSIKKFLSGREKEFGKPFTIEPAVTQATSFVYGNKSNQFYILEPSTKRIIVLNDEGGFVYQYQLPEKITELTDIGYNEATGSLIIYADKLVYELKQ
jgi:hypothetical protein